MTTPKDLTQADTAAAELKTFALLAEDCAQNPQVGAPLRELLPKLIAMVTALAGEVEQLKAEAVRTPCEGCTGAAGLGDPAPTDPAAQG